MGFIIVVLVIGVVLTLTIGPMVALFAWISGRDDGASRYSDYDNKYALPFAILYDIGYTQTDPANKNRAAIKNKQRFNRE